MCKTWNFDDFILQMALEHLHSATTTLLNSRATGVM